MSYDKASFHAKVQRKKLQKAKDAKRAKLAELSSEERAELQKKKYEKSLKDKCQLIVWDYEHNQLPTSKFRMCYDLLKERLKDIEENNIQFVEKEREAIKNVIEKIESVI